MATIEGAFPLRPSDRVPVGEWLDDLRSRLDVWTQGVRSISGEEWQRLHGAVARAVSPDRVQGVLRDFLVRFGLRTDSKDLADEELLALRIRIITFRRGQTIEDYPEHVFPPPLIDL